MGAIKQKYFLDRNSAVLVVIDVQKSSAGPWMKRCWRS